MSISKRTRSGRVAKVACSSLQTPPTSPPKTPRKAPGAPRKPRKSNGKAAVPRSKTSTPPATPRSSKDIDDDDEITPEWKWGFDVEAEIRALRTLNTSRYVDWTIEMEPSLSGKRVTRSSARNGKKLFSLIEVLDEDMAHA